MKGLMGKLFLCTACMVVFSMVMLVGGIFPQLTDTVLLEKQQSMTHTARQVGQMTSELLSNYNYLQERNYEFMLSGMTEGGRNHILVCDADGQIIMSSDDQNRAYKGAFVDKKVRDEVLEKGTVQTIGDLNGLYRGTNYTAGETFRNATGQVVGFVLVSSSVDYVTHMVSEIKGTFYLWMLLTLLITAVVAYFVSRTLTRPLKRMSLAAREFAQGEYTTRVPVTTQDEIGELTVAFNNMADSVQKSEELRRGFLANVSHELRSPMTSIGGFVDGILDGTIPQEREKHYLEIISSEVRRLSRLVSRMLDITRLQAEDPTESGTRFDLCEVVRRVIIAFGTRLEEKSLALDVDIADDAVFQFGNEDAMYQVIYNLMENAVKFSEPERVIELRLAECGRDIVFSITNYGTTIPKEELPYVFDRFHKTDRSRANDKAGLGLGLYIVKTTINQHKGDIGVTSEDGKTRFWFRVPQCRGKAVVKPQGGKTHE